MPLVRIPPKIDLIQEISKHSDFWKLVERPEVASLIQRANDAYLHWDKFRWRALPEDVPHTLIWAYIKFRRAFDKKPVLLRDEKGRTFSYWLPDSVLRILSKIDRWSGETIGTYHPEGLPQRERYIIRSLMEEAIASGQLEGAATTRQMAKAMLRSGRKPRDHSEQMIYNNWITIQHLRSNKEMNLSVESLCEIHAMITERTLKDPADSGRIRTRDDVFVGYREEIVHTPPAAVLLPDRLKALCDFANTDDDKQWIHPVVKATILHFWIGYDHPFVDGNGRTARAIFYWYLLSRNYWLFEYLAISRYFLRAPSQYARAYLYTETDDNDLTYFLVYNLRVVQLAIQELQLYLERKQRELSDANALLRKYRGLNDRQRSLIASALSHPDSEFTVQSHKNVHNIAYDTARHDLLNLVERDLLVKEVRGKSFVFFVSDKIMSQLNK